MPKCRAKTTRSMHVVQSQTSSPAKHLWRNMLSPRKAVTEGNSSSSASFKALYIRWTEANGFKYKRVRLTISHHEVLPATHFPGKRFVMENVHNIDERDIRASDSHPVVRRVEKLGRIEEFLEIGRCFAQKLRLLLLCSHCNRTLESKCI